MSGKTWAEMFPDRKGVVLQDGHVDHITGPRCMVKMSEGPFIGRHIIAHTDTVLAAGTDVLVNDRRGKTMARPILTRTAREAVTEDSKPKFVTVPIEPTREMWAAMADTLYRYENRHHDKVVADLWAAMLTSAPASPSPHPGVLHPRIPDDLMAIAREIANSYAHVHVGSQPTLATAIANALEAVRRAAPVNASTGEQGWTEAQARDAHATLTQAGWNPKPLDALSTPRPTSELVAALLWTDDAGAGKYTADALGVSYMILEWGGLFDLEVSAGGDYFVKVGNCSTLPEAKALALADLNNRLAALAQPSGVAASLPTAGVPEGWRLVPEDAVTHLGDFNEACTIAWRVSVERGDTDNASYWQRQVNTIKAIRSALTPIEGV